MGDQLFLKGMYEKLKHPKTFFFLEDFLMVMYEII